ncbi:MAG: hypothetical protein ACRDP8_13430 [Actinopolymorphaceae bacterium]
MASAPIGELYADNLTDADLALLVQASATTLTAAELRHEPAAVPGLFDRPEVFDAVFGRTQEGDRWLVGVSPFLAFATAVHRSAADLGHTSYLTERTGARERVPVFDGPELAAFLQPAARRLFFAELLASFARVASGRYVVRTARGLRSRRYSELDPVRLAGLLDTVPPAERPGAYRRLGDVALFLSGVFPDYTTRHALGPIDAARLLRAAGIAREEREELATAPAIDLFEQLGARWYRQACALAPLRTVRLEVIAEVAESFRQARRVLNFVADRYLFPAGGGWFTPPSS